MQKIIDCTRSKARFYFSSLVVRCATRKRLAFNEGSLLIVMSVGGNEREKEKERGRKREMQEEGGLDEKGMGFSKRLTFITSVYLYFSRELKIV